MKLASCFDRCPGVWSPNEKTYVHVVCSECERFKQRFDIDRTTKTMQPAEDPVVCEKKIVWGE